MSNPDIFNYESVRDQFDNIHSMTDLETLDCTSTSAFCSFSSILFNPYIQQTVEEIRKLPKVVCNINIVEAINTGTTSQSTIDWWAKQSDAAKNSLSDPQPIRLEAALSYFINLNSHTNRFWSHGKDFDMAILIKYFEKTSDKRLKKLNFRNTMDTRTAYRMAFPKRDYPEMDKEELDKLNSHSAEDDTIKQVFGVQSCYSTLFGTSYSPIVDAQKTIGRIEDGKFFDASELDTDLSDIST